jgi:hypothetical protein
MYAMTTEQGRLGSGPAIGANAAVNRDQDIGKAGGSTVGATPVAIDRIARSIKTTAIPRLKARLEFGRSWSA